MIANRNVMSISFSEMRQYLLRCENISLFLVRWTMMYTSLKQNSKAYQKVKMKDQLSMENLVLKTILSKSTSRTAARTTTLTMTANDEMVWMMPWKLLMAKENNFCIGGGRRTEKRSFHLRFFLVRLFGSLMDSDDGILLFCF